ncbi:MAG: hypothetical protein KJO27_13260 [Gammaproteobacteria bacterium]|nr:hypothetical protein [Gammaproteobacteria bacterium]NNL46375.1 BACON domain-containing protein [Woeseiaceae bacterium]
MKYFTNFTNYLAIAGLVFSLAACGGGSSDSGGGAPGTNVTLSTNNIVFTYAIGGAAPAAQTLSVGFSGDGLVIGYAPGVSEPAWLDVRQADSSDNISPVDIELSVDTGTLTVGTYETSVRFATGDINGNNVSFRDLTVTCIVTNQLTVSQSQFDFTHTDGASVAPERQTLSIDGEGINWTANSDQAWVTLSASSGTAPSSVQLGVDPAGLSSGNYTAAVTVADSSGGNSENVTVNLTVEPHKLFVGDNGVAFATFPTAPSVLTHTVTVSENAGASIPWTASSNSAWLSVTGGGVTDGALTLTADPSGLATDTIHFAEVTVSSGDVTIINDEAITVGFYVSGTDPTATELGVTGRYLVSDPVRPYVYVTNNGATVDIYNIYTGALVNSVTAGVELKAMTVAGSGETLFAIDGDDNSIVPIELSTLTVGSKWPADNFAQINAMLEYTRFNGKGVVISNRREVFAANTGMQVTTVPHPFYDNIILAAAEDGASFFVLRPGVSGLIDLLRYTGDYSTVNDAYSVEQTHALNRSFGNARDIAVNKDGSKIYTADGGEYAFPTFSFDGDAIAEGTVLAANPYPLAVELGPTEKLYGGINAVTGGTDAWSYNVDDSADNTYVINGRLHDRQVRISGDGLRMITLSDFPALTFSTVTP